MTRFSTSMAALLFAVALATVALAGGRPRPDDAILYIVSPADGATVSNPFVVNFGLRGMGIAPAGYHTPTTGHHHLLIDIDELPMADVPIPSDEHHIHFGGGQTETSLTLAPGQHTLRLVFGDMTHLMFDPPLASKQIKITVK